MDDTSRPPLSPAAQTVLDAVDDAFSEQVSLLEESPISTWAMSFMAAAALRAAADQVVPEGGPFLMTASEDRVRHQLLTIAADLEGAEHPTRLNH